MDVLIVMEKRVGVPVLAWIEGERGCPGLRQSTMRVIQALTTRVFAMWS